MSIAAPQDPRIDRAIKACKTQQLLAEAMGVKQQTVSKLLNRERGISAEMALLIDKATNGAVPKHELRPDLFEDPSRKRRVAA